MIAFVLVLAVVLGVCVAVASPWRWRREEAAGDDARERSAQLAVRDLEAARDAKYAEIRDARLDLETGKLSQADFDTVDGGLRAEAVEILRRLDRARSRLERARSEASAPDGAARVDDDVTAASDTDAEAAFGAGEREGPAASTERTGAGSYHRRPT